MNSCYRLKWLPILLGLAIFLTPSCQRWGKDDSPPTAHEFKSDVYSRWLDLFVNLDRYAKGYRPGPSPRAWAYLSVASYEAIVSGMPANNSIQSAFPGLVIPQADLSAEYYWPACVNEVFGYLMPRFFFHVQSDQASLQQRIFLLQEDLRNEFAKKVSAEVLERSEQHGLAVARAIYEWETADLVGHNAFLNPRPTTYIPPAGVGKWQPTLPDLGRPLFPQWGDVRAFVLRPDELLAKPPIPFSELDNSLFFTQAEEVYQQAKSARTDNREGYEKRWEGEFWSDDHEDLTFSPGIRMVAIARQALEQEQADLGIAAELYAKLGIALSDNAVAVWKSKYHYNLERPVTYIRRVVAKKYPEATTWGTNLANPLKGIKGMSPSFPSYPSEHAGFAGVGGAILSSFFEFNAQHPGTYTLTDRCHFNRTEFIGTPRTFKSFKSMAEESAFSRLPMGLHYRMDCVEGLRMGEATARRVLELPWKK